MGFRTNPERVLTAGYSLNQSPLVKNAKITQIIAHGKVINIDDPKDSKRIQVRIPVIDDLLDDEKLPWCISTMPNFFYCLPQVDEYVIILLSNPWIDFSGRFYFGPIMTGDNTDEQSFEDVSDEFGFIKKKDTE